MGVDHIQTTSLSWGYSNPKERIMFYEQKGCYADRITISAYIRSALVWAHPLLSLLWAIPASETHGIPLLTSMPQKGNPHSSCKTLLSYYFPQGVFPVYSHRQTPRLDSELPMILLFPFLLSWYLHIYVLLSTPRLNSLSTGTI